MSSDPLPSMRILVVDDNPTDLIYTQAVLMHGNPQRQVQTCDDAQSALAILSDPGAPRFDLILLDINMPLMDGFEFLKALTPYVGQTAVPVVMLSSSPELDEQKRALAFGQVRGYLVKPLSLDAAAQISHWLAAPASGVQGH